jgi:hypothetical protein
VQRGRVRQEDARAGTSNNGFGVLLAFIGLEWEDSLSIS